MYTKIEELELENVELKRESESFKRFIESRDEELTRLQKVIRDTNRDKQLLSYKVEGLVKTNYQTEQKLNQLQKENYKLAEECRRQENQIEKVSTQQLRNLNLIYSVKTSNILDRKRLKMKIKSLLIKLTI